jgi:hypothetical protein
VKRFFALLLLLGALTGLFGQEAAFAGTLRLPPGEVATGVIPADCMEMMQQEPQQPAEMPCKGMTLDCIAAMGCTIPLFAVPEPGRIGATFHARQVHFLPTVRHLAGLSLAPEPPPPTA